ncbi:hypothetical protein AURDEDRAFT_168808 [Auricularia subglabra TFB-10046 SS5]|nr:hypothetical protein AURDEDRAFT_168808 [Auricularia subglabra TFB-10046 SS5]
MPRLGPTQSMEDFNSRHIDEDFGRPEDDPLALPSSWANPGQRETYGFASLGKREYVLRRCKAMLELARMRAAIHAVCAFFTWKHQNVTGQSSKTRANSKVAAMLREVHRHADVYRRHFSALSALGIEPADVRLLQPLQPNDLKNFHAHSAVPEGLGETLKSQAWFWGGDRDPDDQAARDLDKLTQEGK